MWVTELKILNFKKIECVNASGLGQNNVITGDNATGKSTILEAIKTFWISQGVDPNQITIGKDETEMFLRLDDGAICAERKIGKTKSGNISNNMKVEENGKVIGKGVALMQQLLGDASIDSRRALNFDPTTFIKLDEKKQYELFLRANPYSLNRSRLSEILDSIKLENIGGISFEGSDDETVINLSKLDFGQHGIDVLNATSGIIKDHRSRANKTVTRKQNAIEEGRRTIPENFEPKRFAKFNMSQKLDELKVAQNLENMHKTDLSKIEDLRTDRSDLKDEIAKLEKDKVELEAKLQTKLIKLDDVKTSGKKLKEKIEAHTDPGVSIIEDEIKAYNDSQELIQKLKDIKKMEIDVASVKLTADDLDRLYKYLVNDASKKILSEIDLPVEGVTFEDEKIIVNGLPIKSMSRSEEMKFGYRVAREMLKDADAKIIMMDNFESMGWKLQREFIEESKKHPEYQNMICAVTPGGNLTITNIDKFTNAELIDLLYPRPEDDDSIHPLSPEEEALLQGLYNFDGAEDVWDEAKEKGIGDLELQSLIQRPFSPRANFSTGDGKLCQAESNGNLESMKFWYNLSGPAKDVLPDYQGYNLLESTRALIGIPKVNDN